VKRSLVLLALVSLVFCRERSRPVPMPDWQYEISRSADRWLRDYPEVRLLRDYVRIDTTNPPGNERRGAEFLRDELACEGIPSQLLCPEASRCNLYARLPGADHSRAIVLLNHIDVVPAYSPHWHHDPFGGEIATSYLYGRGSYDMKSVGVVQLAAFVALARSGLPLARDVIFLAEADEEEFGGKLGSDWILARRPELLSGVDLVLNEGGYQDVVAGFPRAWQVEIGQTALGTFFQGSDEKAAIPAGGYRDLGGFTVPSEQVRRVLRESADIRPPFYVRGLLDPERLAREPDVRKFTSPMFLALVAPMAYETGPISRQWLLGWNLSHAWESQVAVSVPYGGGDPRPWVEMVKAEGRKNGLSIEHEVVIDAAPPSPYPSPDTETLRNTVAVIYPGVRFVPIINGFAESTSTLFRARGVPAYGFTPFLIDAMDAARRHGNDERIFLPFFTRGATVMREVLFELATTPPARQELSGHRGG
jgi:acetylornithine deacetylase/succinyl-diaminopimelate desuccinylase-like protein